MLSLAQWTAFGAFVHRAMHESSLGDGDLPMIPTTRVTRSNQDHPHGVPSYVTLRHVASVPMGAEPERLHALVDVPEGIDPDDPPNPFPQSLRTTLRQVYETTISVQVSVRVNDADPESTPGADQYLRRLELFAWEDDVRAELELAGLGLKRVGEIRDLARLNGVQWETRAAIDLVVECTPMVVVNPGRVESVAGEVEVTTDDDGNPPAVVPFEAEQEG